MAGSVGGIKAGKAFIIIDAVDRTGVVLKRVGRQLQGFATKLQGIGQKFMAKGLTALLPAAASLKVFANFDDAMRRVEARSSGTAQEMKALREEAKLLGRTTSFTATQVGDLMGKLAQKNFNRREMKSMTGDVLNLARAAGSGGEEDTSISADLISGTLRAFKMEATESGKVADIFATAVNNSNFDLQGLMDGMKKAAPLAKEYGLSLEETTASLAAMTNLNIEASEAGTAFQSFLARMSQSQYVDKFNSGLEDMGQAAIDFRDEGGNLRKPMDIMDEIAQKTQGMGSAVKGELLSALFGVRQFGKAAGSISGGDSARELLDKLQKSGGNAAKTAKDMDRGIGGSFRKIFSAVEGLAIGIGEILAPTVANLVDKATEWIGVATEWLSANKGLVVLVTGLAAGAVALGVALVATGVGISLLGTLFTVLGTVLTAVKLLFIGLYAVITSPFTLVALMVAGVIVALWKFSGAFREVFGGLGAWVSESFSRLGETISKTFGGVLKALGQGDFMTAWDLLVQGASLIWFQFMDILGDGWSKFTGFFIEAWTGAMASMKKLWFSAQSVIAQGILDLAAQEGLLGDVFDLVLGVDVSDERKKAIDLERRRIEGNQRRGLESDPQADAFEEARNAMTQGFTNKINKAADDAGEGLSQWNAKQAEANRGRQEEIDKRKAALDALVDEVEAREEAKEKLEDGPPGAGGGGEDTPDILGPGGGTGGGVGLTVNSALMAGTVEAARQAIENSSRAEEARDLDEERNNFLEELNQKLDNMEFNIA